MRITIYDDEGRARGPEEDLRAQEPLSVSRRRLLFGAAGLAVLPLAVRAATEPATAQVVLPEAGSAPVSAPSWTVLQATALLGVYYLPDKPTVTMQFIRVAESLGSIPNVAGRAQSWRVIDAHGHSVGSSECAESAKLIKPLVSGTWVGGGAAVPGHYTVVTDNTVTGVIVICPATRMWKMPGVGSPYQQAGDYTFLEAWLGASTHDRDYYAIPRYDPARIFTYSITADPYHTGPQDPGVGRRHRLWFTSSDQPSDPTRSPSPQSWAALASAAVAAGHRGACYELPTNEPENGGWSLTDIIAYFNACKAAIKTVDPTAVCMGFDSGGIFNNSPLSALAQFIAHCAPDAITNHNQNSHQNLSNIVALRQYVGAIKGQFAASGQPALALWGTETGINGGQYNVLHPRREARQRTVLRLVYESFGFPAQQMYDMRGFDEPGAGYPSYMVDVHNWERQGNMRAGAVALHVMGEALWGTTCTPESPPAALSFGPKGTAGDSLLMGLHYSGTDRDVVTLATNGIEAGTVTLKVSCSGTVTYWNGLGAAATTTVVNGQITVPVDDLLTYVFLPKGTAVTAAPGWWAGLGVVGQLAGGSFAANLQGGGVPGSLTPPVQTTELPWSTTITTTKPGKGFALLTSGPAWQEVGCSLIDFGIAVNGRTVYHYTCPSAQSQPIPAPTRKDSADPCAYTTWWTSPFGWLHQVVVPAGTVTLTVNRVSTGGQPDHHGTYPGTTTLRLANFQVLG